MVTTKGAGLNPNAKVWQEIPAHQGETPEGPVESSWLQMYPHNPEGTEGFLDVSSPGGKECDGDYPDSADYSYVPADGVLSGSECHDVGFLVFDSQGEPAADGDVPKEQPMSEENLRESLKKLLEFCFSRENLSKDLYLISQMDSDQFVPLWTIACMEDVKALTTDVDLIRDILQASPVVEVDESGEKARPNHSRSIIILREVPETTPLEEVEALFKGEHCPKVLSVEFAHNNNWYITFRSDMDALQAYKYLREEVKSFQGRPIMARIKAINTFFGKNGFRSGVDSSAYGQQAQALPPPFGSPVYMQQVYGGQQQYPVYPVASPSWNPSVVPYFETPLAPFPNAGFMSTYSNNGSYKENSRFFNGHRPDSRIRNHLKAHSKAGGLPSPSSLAPGSLMNGLSSPLCLQPHQTSRTLVGSGPEAVRLPFFCLSDTQSGIRGGGVNRTGQARRSTFRGGRKKAEDEHTRPLSAAETKVPPPPKFDLAASNFPPLPGCGVSPRRETPSELRCLSDVVRGVKVTEKTANTAACEAKHADVSADVVKTCPPAAQTTTTATATGGPPADEDVEKDDVLLHQDMTSTPPDPPAPLENTPPTSSQSAPAEAPPPSPSERGPKKLSYAEVCQRLAQDPPPPQKPPPPDSQPLQELKVNGAEEPRPASRRDTDQLEKPGGSCPSRSSSAATAGFPGSGRSSGTLKVREHQRGLNKAKPFPPQRGVWWSGKEQNIPPK